MGVSFILLLLIHPSTIYHFLPLLSFFLSSFVLLLSCLFKTSLRTPWKVMEITKTFPHERESMSV